MSVTEDLSFVKTRCAELRKDAAESFECVVFESGRKNSANARTSSKRKLNSFAPNNSEIDVKKVKREVIKFGLTGFDSKTKQEAKIEHAIRLGAKPPKNKFVNYKDFKAERANQLKKAKEEKCLMEAGKVNGISNDKGLKYLAKKQRKDTKKDNILQAYGKVRKSFKGKKGWKKR